MANNGIIIGGVIATIGVAFAVFVMLSSTSDIPNTELIVSNGNHLETVGDITSIQASSGFSLIEQLMVQVSQETWGLVLCTVIRVT